MSIPLRSWNGVGLISLDIGIAIVLVGSSERDKIGCVVEGIWCLFHAQSLSLDVDLSAWLRLLF